MADMQDVEITSLGPHVMRSKTPEVSEKMALYFESMRGTTPDPPQSVHSGEDIALSERSVPQHRSRNYDNGYYHTGADPNYSMLPPEMRREDSSMRLEREVFGDDPHGGSDYLRSATGRNGNGNGAEPERRSVAGDPRGEGGHVGPRMGREGSYVGGDDGYGPQRVREEVRNGWDDQVRSPTRSYRQPAMASGLQNPHYARSTGGHTAAGFALPESDTSESEPLPMPRTVPHSRAASVAPAPPPVIAPKHQSMQTQSSEPSFGPGLVRESAAYAPLTQQPPSPAQRVQITIQPPTDPAHSRAHTPAQIHPSKTDDGGSVRTERTGARSARTGPRSIAEEGQEWSRRERHEEAKRERELEKIREEEDFEAARKRRDPSPSRTARTARTERTTRSILKQASVHPEGITLPMSGRTTPATQAPYQPFRADARSQYEEPPADPRYGGPPPAGQYGGPAAGTYGPPSGSQYGGPPAGAQYAATAPGATYGGGPDPFANDYVNQRAPSAYAPSQKAPSAYDPPAAQPPRSTYGGGQRSAAPSRYEQSQAAQSPTRSQYAPSRYAASQAAPQSPPHAPVYASSRYAPSQAAPQSRYAPSQAAPQSPPHAPAPYVQSRYAPSQAEPQSPPGAPSAYARSQAPVSPRSRAGTTAAGAPPLHFGGVTAVPGGTGGNIDIEFGKDGETIVKVHNAPERPPSRAPSRAASQAPPPPPANERREPSIAPPRSMRAEPLSHTPRTSYTMNPTDLAEQVSSSHFHDEDLCVLLKTADDPNMPEVVRRAVRRAVVKRMRKLGMEGPPEDLLKSPRTTHRSPTNREREYATPTPVMAVPFPPPVPVVVNLTDSSVPPTWAAPLFDMLARAQSRLDDLDTKLESVRPSNESIPDEEEEELPLEERIEELPDEDELDRPETIDDAASQAETEKPPLPPPRSPQPKQQDVTVHVGNVDITIRQPATRESTPPAQDNGDEMAAMRAALNKVLEPSEAGGQTEPLVHDPEEREEELYKLRQKPVDRSDAVSHRTWEIEREDGKDETIPDLPPSAMGNRAEPYARKESPPLPPLPQDEEYDNVPQWQRNDNRGPAPWQLVHQRLLNWAIVWPTKELEDALLSCSRGHQVDEVALSIWTAQVYKRYIRARKTDAPDKPIERLFVPPNMADAINNAVFNGRHNDACGMLRDLWAPFGLAEDKNNPAQSNMPRLLVVLARHRRDENHWVVHRFSLPDGSLTTYDTYPERSLPDGRPLGWWFAIRIAWPHAMYPHPDHLVQKMVRLHRPLQLLCDNSVAAAAIWRNILMGSKPERQVDLERLRDLVSSEVKNLRTRKDMGRLSISTGSQWDFS